MPDSIESSRLTRNGGSKMLAAIVFFFLKLTIESRSRILAVTRDRLFENLLRLATKSDAFNHHGSFTDRDLDDRRNRRNSNSGKRSS